MNNFPERPTLVDVAERAGVSVVTVSRVVAQSAKVAAKTRSRVQRAMDELGYYGNAAASQLVSGRAHTVGVITSGTVEYGYGSVISGIEERARREGIAVLIAVIDDDGPESVRETLAHVVSQTLAGLVLIDFDPRSHMVAAALPSYIPAVSITGPYGAAPLLPTVCIDEYQGTLESARHLIGLGHESVFVLGPPHDDPPGRRSQGVLDALDEARLPHYPAMTCADWRPASGYVCMRDLLERYGDVVTAVSCANDEIALGAVRAICEAGLRVPGDISVVGCDDNPLAAFASPPLTTVRQDFIGLGSRTLELLLDVIDGDPAPRTEHAMHPSLIIRESTGPRNPSRGIRLGSGAQMFAKDGS